MTEKISLNLTLEELEIIDKYIELNDDTRQLFDKIQKAYPKSPVEAAYKRVFGAYPPTTPSVSNYEDNRWSAFQSGYSCGYGDGLENSNEISKKPVEKQSKTLTDMIFFTNGEEKLRIPPPFSHNHYVGTKCPETKLEVKKMTIRAEQIVNATLELTLRPQSEDRKKVVACVIREVADRLCTDLGELQCPIEVLREIADEVEAL